MPSLRLNTHLSILSGQVSSRQRQSGIATILIMLLVGLSLTATVLGVMHYIRGTQSQLVSVHAQTQAQMRAWTGADALGKFLDELQKNGSLVTLATQVKTAQNANGSTGISITGVTGVSARIVSVDSASSPKLFTAEITGVAVEGSQAESRSILNVVYKLEESSSSTNVPGSKGISFNKNFRPSGGITVETETGSKGFEINVLGDLSTGGNSITGVSKISSTGTISIGSSSTFGELHANCDVNLTGSVTAGIINARRNVCLSGGASGTAAINANGSVYAEGGYDLNGAIAALGSPTGVESCAASGTAEDAANNIAGTCATPKPAYVVDLGKGGTVDWQKVLRGDASAGAKSVKAKGGVLLGYGVIGDLLAEGDLNANWNAKVNSGGKSGAISGKIIYPGTIDKTAINVTESTTGLTVSIPEVTAVSIDTYVIDAYGYVSIANYAFRVDAGGYKKVTVSNVSGIADGEYYLGDYAANQVDFLCAKLAADSTSSAPKCLGTYNAASSLPTICKGKSPEGHCFDYKSSTKTWSVAAGNNTESIAQGIVWFEGDLSVGSSGPYYNTVIATGNITTSGNVKVYAPNYAGYSGTMGATVYAPTGICVNSNFPDIYPKQFCDKTKQAYLNDADDGIGNYVFIAGSVPLGTTYSKDTYVGGDISPGASTELFGSVMAGNQYASSGDTTIHGYMTALAAGRITNNSFNGKTTVRLIGLPASFDPAGSLPGGCLTNCGGGTTTTGWKIHWSRYL